MQEEEALALAIASDLGLLPAEPLNLVVTDTVIAPDTEAVVLTTVEEPHPEFHFSTVGIIDWENVIEGVAQVCLSVGQGEREVEGAIQFAYLLTIEVGLSVVVPCGGGPVGSMLL